MQCLKKKAILEVTVWDEIYMGFNYREFWRFFVDLRLLNPVKTNSLQQNRGKIYSFFYTAELKSVNSATNTTIYGFHFCYFQILYMKSAENYSHE